MRISKKAGVITGIAALTTVSFAGGAAAATTGLAEVLFGSPSVGGQTNATQVGWGNGINGEAASFVVERTAQRSGMSEDDGAAFVGRSSLNSPSYPAILGDGGRSAGVKAVGQGSSGSAVLVVDTTANLASPGSKKGIIGADIEGSVKITGKKNSKETSTALLYVEGTDLKVDINGQTFVLTEAAHLD